MKKSKIDLQKKKGVVAYFDILGFKNLVLDEEDAEKIYDNILKILNKTKRINNEYEKFLKVNELKDIEELSQPIDIFVFSDSFFLFQELGDLNFESNPLDQSTKNFLHLFVIEEFLILLQDVFDQSLEISLPIKGSITVGNYYLDRENNIIFGKSIIKAYQLAEDLKTIAIVLDEKLENLIEEISDPKDKTFNSFPITKGITTFKEGKVISSVIDLKSTKKKDRILKAMQTCSGSTRKYYMNTLEMFKISPF